MAENADTKQEILNASLNLFSSQGYEATSVSQIANAVGIRKASLYSHFASKQEILDELMKNVLEEYERRSVFTNADWSAPDFTKDKENFTPDDVVQTIIGQIRYILHDPKISRARKMLTIEQFRNPQMADMQTKQNYADIMRYFIGMIGFLTERKKLRGKDVELMAAGLCLPISVWINLCDREPQREGEVIDLIERHVRQFFALYEKA